MRQVDIWFSDCEVFAEDLIWVFKNKRSGEVRWFHNDTKAVESFIAENPNMWLCGYNFRDYDQYILKGTLLHLRNDQLKMLNDLLIFGELQNVWDYLGEDAWDVQLPPIIDLFHDIVPRKSLKEIEGNIGMDVVETGVSFDINRKLTQEELDISIKYCIHDVEATEALYFKRLEYISTKKTLCEMTGLDDAEMMKNTNARVVSEALRASFINPLETFGNERYMDIIPDHIIQFDKLPKVVQEYVGEIDSYSGWFNHMEPLLFDLWGTPTVMGIGGIHASTGYIDEHVLKGGPRKGEIEYRVVSTPKRFVSDEDRMIIIQDIGSFYPSMMILFNYLSRAVPEEQRQLFEDFYKMRMSAKKMAAECKAKGDFAGAAHWTGQANAAKLVLNTVYGCMKNQYNKLYDPFMSTCVCVSGQLFIIDLMNRIHERVPDMEIVQLNTDGWVLSIKRSDYDAVQLVVEEWKRLTGFTVDTDPIKQMWQRDVNNYVIEFENGAIKAKGGTVKNWKGGSFSSNSMTIIDKALVEYMINGVSLYETISTCDDMERFQIILKAGSGYNRCCKAKDGTEDYVPIDGKVHRVYAVKEGSENGYTFFKQKDGGNPARFPDTPAWCAEDFSIKGIDEIDKAWYTALAARKLNAFIKGKE